MERRKCTREFNVEAVKSRSWGDGDASGSLPPICRRPSGPGADEARAGGTRTAPRAVIKLKTERDIFKKSVTYFAKEAQWRSPLSRHTEESGLRNGSARRSGSHGQASMPGGPDRRVPGRGPTISC